MKRREALQFGLFGSLAAHTTANTILFQLVQGLFHKAYAQKMGTEPRALVQFMLSGGFPMHFISNVLNLSSEFSTMGNQWISNYWNGSLQYRTHRMTNASGEGYEMPWVWSASLPRSVERGGGAMSTQSLFSNSLMVQGIYGPLDSHGLCRAHAYRSTPTGLSIGGMVADHVSAEGSPIPALAIRPNGDFSFGAKRSGVKLVSDASNVNGGNILRTTLDPVLSTPDINVLLANRESFKSAFDSAIQKINRDLVPRLPGSEAVLKSVASAENLIQRNFGNLASQWTSLINKYNALIAGCRNISTLLPISVNPEQPVDPNAPDFRRLDQGGYSSHSDLRSIISSSATVFRLASSCAATEFFLKENLVQYMAAEVGGLGGMSFATIGNALGGGPGTTNGLSSYGLDQHATGAGVSCVVNNFHAFAQLACYNELALSLKDSNRFDDVVIQITTDFTRSPLADGSGSDHGWRGMSSLILSGAIKDARVVGNVRGLAATNGSGPNVTQNQYRGHWGTGGLANHEGTRQYLSTSHVISSLAHLCRVPSPVANFLPIFGRSSRDDLQLFVEESKIVES